MKAENSCSQELNIRLHFKDQISEEAESTLWSEIFNILGIFDDQLNKNNS